MQHECKLVRWKLTKFIFTSHKIHIHPFGLILIILHMQKTILFWNGICISVTYFIIFKWMLGIYACVIINFFHLVKWTLFSQFLYIRLFNSYDKFVLNGKRIIWSDISTTQKRVWEKNVWRLPIHTRLLKIQHIQI